MDKLGMFRYFMGYVTVSISGDMAERILNLCNANGITLWDISKRNNVICASLSVKDFKKLRHLKRKVKVKIHITEKKGLLFFTKRYRLRLGFVVGFIIFALFITMMSQRIWDVKINCKEEINKTEILEFCNSCGIYEGASKNNIDTAYAALKIELKFDEIAWAAVNIEGTTANIDIEKTVEEKYEIKSEPSNIVAGFSGIIKSLKIKSGFSRVKVGDTVEKGDILVDGARLLNNGTYEYCRSDGEIFAQTERTFTVTENFAAEIYQPQGKKKTKNVLKIFDGFIPLYLGDIKDNSLSRVYANSKIFLGKKLPFAVYSRKYFDTDKVKIKRSAEEAVVDCRAVLNRTVNSLNAEKYAVKSEKISKDNGSVSVTWLVSANESIGFEEKIGVF